MKTIHTLFLLCFILFLSCTKQEDDLSYPDCLQEEIDYILENEPVASFKRRILKYRYNNTYVYLLSPPDAIDAASRVMDRSCYTFCSMGGGWGNSCENWDDAELIGTVWIDPR